jgi:hypothetical protein
VRDRQSATDYTPTLITSPPRWLPDGSTISPRAKSLGLLDQPEKRLRLFTVQVA